MLSHVTVALLFLYMTIDILFLLCPLLVFLQKFQKIINSNNHALYVDVHITISYRTQTALSPAYFQTKLFLKTESRSKRRQS